LCSQTRKQGGVDEEKHINKPAESASGSRLYFADCIEDDFVIASCQGKS